MNALMIGLSILLLSGVVWGSAETKSCDLTEYVPNDGTALLGNPGTLLEEDEDPYMERSNLSVNPLPEDVDDLTLRKNGAALPEQTPGTRQAQEAEEEKAPESQKQ